MNTVYFWQDVDAGFRNLHRMVETRLVLGIGAPHHLREMGFEDEGFRVEPVEWYADRLEAAGFRPTVLSSPNGDMSLLVGER